MDFLHKYNEQLPPVAPATGLVAFKTGVNKVQTEACLFDRDRLDSEPDILPLHSEAHFNSPHLNQKHLSVCVPKNDAGCFTRNR